MIKQKISLIVIVGLSLLFAMVYVAQEPKKEPEIVTHRTADDYEFEGKEFEHTAIDLKVVVISTQEKFDELTNRLVPGVGNLQAFSSINPTTNTCTVYVKDPTWEYSPEFIGHEFAHCVWGRWHNHRDQRETQLLQKEMESSKKK